MSRIHLLSLTKSALISLFVLKTGDTMTGLLTTTALTISSGALTLPAADTTGVTSVGWITSLGNLGLGINGNTTMLNCIDNSGGNFTFTKGGSLSNVVAQMTRNSEFGIGAAATAGVQLMATHASNPGIGLSKTDATAHIFFMQAQGNALFINRNGNANRGITILANTDGTLAGVGIFATSPSALFSIAEKLLVDTNGIMTKYNNVSTAGWGAHVVYGTGRSTGQTGAVTSVATYTCGAADGSFYVSANVNVTTYIAGTITALCDYTDETNTARTLTFTFSNLTGTLLSGIGATGPFEGLTMHIRVKASTQIKIYTTVSLANFTYNVEGYISQIG